MIFEQKLEEGGEISHVGKAFQGAGTGSTEGVSEKKADHIGGDSGKWELV